METANLSAIEEWWKAFEEKPFEALDNLLFDRVYMGRLDPNETDEILFRLFNNKSNKILHQLDGLMQKWFETHWGNVPGSISSSQWANVLQHSFMAIYRLNLWETARFLRDSYISERTWIRSLYIVPSRDPEGWLLRTLALCQKDQKLLPIWMRICRWEEDIPVHYTSIGLMGLRKLPDKNGEPPGDIPKAFFKGVVSLAEAMKEKKKPRYKEAWLREMSAVIALYPRSKRYWADHFSHFLSYMPDSPSAQWLDKVIPKLSAQFNRKANLFLEPPPRDKMTYLLKLIKIKSLKEIRDELDLFFDSHRAYAYQTGDSYFLVRTFSNIGYKIFRQDTAYVLGLMEEAFAWEPYNPLLWIQRANIEAFRGNSLRAEGLFWEAKRRFPENPDIRNNLSKLLGQQGRYEIAETLYRQTMEDFPSNVVCRNGLTVVLVKLRQKDEAVALLRETLEKFPGNEVAKGFLEKIIAGKEISAEDEKKLEKEISGFDYQVKPPVSYQFENGKEVIVESDKEAQAPKQMDEYVISTVEDRIADVAKIQYNKELEKETPEPVTVKPSKEEVEIGKIEIELGEMSMVLWQSKKAKGKEMRKYRAETSTALEKILKKAPQNIPALLAKGFWLADNDPDRAEEHLSQQAAAHPNTLGFHLMELRVKGFLNKEIDNAQWHDLMQSFPGRSTIVKLEHTLQEMGNGNGRRIHESEQLRKRILKKSASLPVSLRKNEEWVRSTIKQGLFKGIDISHPITGKSFDTVEKNFQKNQIMLKHTVEQSVSSAV